MNDERIKKLMNDLAGLDFARGVDLLTVYTAELEAAHESALHAARLDELERIPYHNWPNAAGYSTYIEQRKTELARKKGE